VTAATILIPTYRHAALLPFALRSALAQTTASIEVLVVGDGVEDDTRTALHPFLDDSRVRFFDFPKGERHGEAHRHETLTSAKGRIVCYLSDDDLLLPEHVTEMLRLLDRADFAHSPAFRVRPDGSLGYRPADLSSPVFVERLRAGGRNAVGLTGSAHTLAAYRRLRHGWRPAPAGTPTDLHMWRQFFDLPGVTCVSGTRLTHLHFPDRPRASLDVGARVAELEGWTRRMTEQGFRSQLDELAIGALSTLAAAAAEENARLRDLLETVQRSLWWRLGGPVRRARRPSSRPPTTR